MPFSCPMWKTVERQGEVYSLSIVEEIFKIPLPSFWLNGGFLYPKVRYDS